MNSPPSPHRPLLAVALAVTCTLSSCTVAPPYRLNHAILNGERELPRTVLLVPPLMVTAEISAGGVIEEVPEWTEESVQGVTAAMRAFGPRARPFEKLELHELTPEENAVVDDHLALYELVANTGMSYPNPRNPAESQAWLHKARHFDLTIGPGLAFLADASGADTALLVSGVSVIPTEAREGTALLATVLLGAPQTTGMSTLSVGLVDLRSGDLLWYGRATKPSTSLSSAHKFEDAGQMTALFETLFGECPEFGTYREFVR